MNSIKFIKSIHEFTGVSLHWLILGEGEMYPSETPESEPNPELVKRSELDRIIQSSLASFRVELKEEDSLRSTLERLLRIEQLFIQKRKPKPQDHTHPSNVLFAIV